MRPAALPGLRPGFSVIAIAVHAAAVLNGPTSEAALLLGAVCTVKLAVSLVLAVMAAHVVDASLPLLGIHDAALKARFGDCSFGDLAFFVGAPAFHTFALMPVPHGETFGASYLATVSSVGAAFLIVAAALHMVTQPATRPRHALGLVKDRHRV